MSTSRYVGRHGSSRPSPLSRLGALPSSMGTQGARAAAKTVAGVGIVLGSGAFVIAPTSAADVASGSDLSMVGAADSSVADLLGDRAGDSAAARSASRPPAAITAPVSATARQAHATAGGLALDPVVKPKPKPAPEHADTPDTPSADRESTQTSRDSQRTSPQSQESSSSSSAPSTPSGGSVVTGNYASQAAAIGLGPNAQRVYSAVRTQFADMTNIGGYRAGDPGDHGSGQAVDIMVTGARGDQVNAWLQQHAGELNIKYIIWQQRIWFPGGSSKMMADRGSPTQNHYDHVHVSVN